MTTNTAYIDFDKRGTFLYDRRAKEIERLNLQFPYDFLYSGKLPVVSQRTETRFRSPPPQGNSHLAVSCILSGVVTRVEPAITSALFEHPDCKALLLQQGITEDCFDDMTGLFATCPTSKQARALMSWIPLMQKMFGTVHGQRIVGYSVLSPEYHDMQDRLPFSANAIYRIQYKADIRHQNKWVVESINRVQVVGAEHGDNRSNLQKMIQSLPDDFCKWHFWREYFVMGKNIIPTKVAPGFLCSTSTSSSPVAPPETTSTNANDGDSRTSNGELMPQQEP